MDLTCLCLVTNSCPKQQAGTADQPISAIQAAINTKTTLLLGLWASGNGFQNEINALKKTIDQYCSKLDGLVAGISIGSEDLYRDSDLGKKNSNGLPGANAQTLVNYIKQVRDTVKGSCLKDAPIGHVDTWSAYVDGANKPVIDALDWLGMDTYPYFEDDKDNQIANGRDLYLAALQKIQNAGPGKPIWVTETGWPVSGKKSGGAVPSKENAQDYWQKVGCPMFGKTNVWWYTMQDAEPQTPNPSFGVIGSDLNSEPLFDLSCKGHENPPAPASSSAPASASKSSAPASQSSSAPTNNQSSSKPTTTEASKGPASSQPTTMATTNGNGNGSNTQGQSKPTQSANNGGSSDNNNKPSQTSSAAATKPSVGAAGNLNTFGAAGAAVVLAALAL